LHRLSNESETQVVQAVTEGHFEEAEILEALERQARGWKQLLFEA
jgi:hypothetical protein